MIAVAVTLAATGAATVYFVSSGGKGEASAATSLADYVPIAKVAPNVVTPRARRGASTGTFIVDCGTNRNGKFSPDNPVAQPGIRNGAEHVHDFVGNQAITADTSDEALAASGTTCRNGDRSSYFWPVVRIDKAVRANAGAALATTTPTVSCPRVRDRLPAVPARLRAAIDRRLAELDRAVAAANDRIAAGKGRIDPDLNDSVIARLRAERATALKKISRMLNIRSARMVSLVECEVSYDGMHAGHTTASTRSVANPSVRCPSVRDKLPGVPDQALAEVDRNLAELDRQIADADERLVRAPGDGGVLGALQAKRTATIERIVISIGRVARRPEGLDRLAACTLGKGQDAGNQNGQALPDPSGPDLELPGNTGGIVRPAAVLIEYRGNPTGKVSAMPRFLRALTGDAKPTSRGPANARATWTCSGFADRLSDKYPICPAGSKVQRVQDFPGCWNGKDIDSDNHRAHLAFADRSTGACPQGFKAIPQLRITISYDIPRDVQARGQFALDSFPEENHNPFSDHNDFINVNSDRQMRKITACLNNGRRCA
ncbi:DUF1996 domain-containing protein [Amorphoplanes digitatis]|uniref:DUF1996 domain-containing protein n=1 Tax=Actinoplanes digitatis TaxID=1868 RepID=A0A7W7HVN5_9ACTN|nr:DUF1996 domain-containing protein [Actinoplanes digitatis]MBB4761531.1 hypothetical protein [Actinoplanes digitatis]